MGEKPVLVISALASDPPQVHQDSVPGHHVASAEGAPAALVLGHDVRVRGRQHAAAAGDVPGVRASTGPAALHHDSGEPGRDAAVWVDAHIYTKSPPSLPPSTTDGFRVDRTAHKNPQLHKQ